MSNPIVLKKGLNIPVKGEADLNVSKTIAPQTIAIRPSDFKGIMPRLLVKEGSRVLCGSPVLADKMNPDILVTSPVSGSVKEVVRGDKRKLLAVIIEADEVQEYAPFKTGDPASLDAESVKSILLGSGLWPLLIQRPYGTIANPGIKPKAIFVSAFNTAPLAPCMEFTLGNEVKFIQTGINALSKLTDGKIHVSVNSDESSFLKLQGVVFHSFKGRHPAGNVGVQISHISPIRKEETVWTISLQGLSFIGKLLQNGKLDLKHKVAVTGPMAIEPTYVECLPGTPMKAFTAHIGTDSKSPRIISGDMLTGKTEGKDGHLGFYDSQITLLDEGDSLELLGWARPLRYKLFSTDHCYFSWLTPWRKYDMDTNLHGGPRAFVMSDQYYAKVLPMDIYPLYLIKACLAGDIDKMEKFGIYEVLPEDLALCEYIDPSKNDIQMIIAKGIDLMLKEMA